MFNRNIGDDEATVQEIVEEAVERSRDPSLSSYGSGSSYSSITSDLTPYDPDFPNSDPYSGDSGVTVEGEDYYPFILFVDSPFIDLGAYVVTGKPIRNYYNANN